MRREWVEKFSGASLKEVGRLLDLHPEDKVSRKEAFIMGGDQVVEGMKGNIEEPIGLIKIPVAAAGECF
jgi:hydroxymethylglutaryl-CoA reductase